MKSLIFALGLSIAATPAFATNITYLADIEYPASGIEILGLITTDGNHGVLSAADILGTHLVAIADGVTIPLFEGSTTVSVVGGDLTAFANYLMFDFGADDGGIFSLTGSLGPAGIWCNGAAEQEACPQGLTVSGGSPFSGSTAYLSTNTVIATTPEASTWAMMGLGFAGLGFMGWRRTQKKAARTEVRAAQAV